MQMSVASLLPADSQGMIVSFNYALQVYFVKKKNIGNYAPIYSYFGSLYSDSANSVIQYQDFKHLFLVHRQLPAIH